MHDQAKLLFNVSEIYSAAQSFVTGYTTERNFFTLPDVWFEWWKQI